MIFQLNLLHINDMREQKVDVLAVIPTKSCHNNETTQQSNNGPSSSVVAANEQCRNYQIFLGGSCNPTTWRHTVAIPLLTSLGITYYNPQVDDWRPEMIQLESQAKSCADILFFVIDKQTRSTVGMIESAFIAGSKRKLILVIYPLTIDSDATLITSNSSSKLLKNASLSTVASTPSTPSIMSSSSASSLSSMYITTTSSKSSDCPSYFHTNYYGYNNLIKISGEYVTPKEFSELRRARLLLQDLVLNRNIPIFCDTKQALVHAVKCLKSNVTPQELGDCGEDFISIRASYNLRKFSRSSTGQSCSKMIREENCNNLQEHKDIYLCLIDGDHSWKESKALPWFDKKGLSCNYVLKDDKSRLSQEFSLDESFEILEGEDLSLLRSEICAIEHSSVLLFVITDKCRGLSLMLLAAHYISLRRGDIVLCIQYLEEPCVVEGETLSKTAIADYNRGRIYLEDHAKNSDVPVFSDLEEAMECCGRKCEFNHESNDCR